MNKEKRDKEYINNKISIACDATNMRQLLRHDFIFIK